MTDKQPITLATLKIDGVEFWDWLAEEADMDLSELTLVGANELPSGDVEFVVKRKERIFTEAMIVEALKPVKLYPEEYLDD